jgi:hypothetical protein
MGNRAICKKFLHDSVQYPEDLFVVAGIGSRASTVRGSREGTAVRARKKVIGRSV